MSTDMEAITRQSDRNQCKGPSLPISVRFAFRFPTVGMGKERRDVQSGRLGGGGDTRPGRQA